MKTIFQPERSTCPKTGRCSSIPLEEKINMDNSNRALRISIVTQWILIIAGVVIGLYEDGHLPEPLRSYIVAQDNEPVSQSEMIVMGSSILFLIGLMISSVGVYRVKSWARTPYVVCTVLISLLLLSWRPVITPPIQGTIEYLANAIEGFIIALMYFSSAREVFNNSLSENSNHGDAPDPEAVR
jgi:hypothetical protein